MMGILSNKLQERFEAYSNSTIEIIVLFENRLDQAVQIFSKNERKIKWFSVEIVADIPDFLSVKGTFSPEIGEIVIYGNNQRIEMTEEFVKEYPFIVFSVILPIKILEEGDPLQIASRIQQFHELNGLMNNDEIVQFIKQNKLTDINDIMTNEKLLSLVTKPKQFEGFNVDDFDEDQIRQIAHFSREYEKIKN